MVKRTSEDQPREVYDHSDHSDLRILIEQADDVEIMMADSDPSDIEVEDSEDELWLNFKGSVMIIF